ncbi:MAG: hypothetical protein COZ06_04505 [Armatimonadetes bacterium CG_4_10_14_3_um_filter_66_18]|nr:hypothetical protein [Armatimonadota bacterium]OIO94627.1 MAG: hypothetical protein AUJ96_28360 [Armatimonadetes bacterium CG2_30_66_41]PIU95080.1 MAG: hypothetical protein COS65_04180 [Armatimonadetes bacterium CG06_land_8_20_14_3_00_66_21]PIX41021.1 MAG: hypothetical protein COZ57_24425 [Armatimonadetes bacterium CG_4_8_14_3_um_filter_66_20]PIY51561.1 MAG: hypothetical protein COZ06_04505 [Armatimonadetes bacterium CG_4_10_14_3_um_filter_66_18]PIZ35145.1 MAG: hypothetical protein COY42_27
MRSFSLSVAAALLAAFCPLRQSSAGNLDLSVEPSTTMDITETTNGVPASASVDLSVWRLGYGQDLGRDWSLLLSYATGHGQGGIVRDLDRQDYDVTATRLLYQAPADKERPAAVAAGVGYHVTSFKFPSFNVLDSADRQSGLHGSDRGSARKSGPAQRHQRPDKRLARVCLDARSVRWTAV